MTEYKIKVRNSTNTDWLNILDGQYTDFSPTGNIISTDVQAAIEEVEAKISGAAWAPLTEANDGLVMGLNTKYVINAGAAFTLHLPVGPVLGNSVFVHDALGTTETYNVTIGRNGHNIMGTADDLIINVNNGTVELVYIDVTTGWKVLQIILETRYGNLFK